MRNKNRAFVLDIETTASQIKGIIAGCDYFIGCRMHALIAAISSTVPTLCLAYSSKVMEVIGKDLDCHHVIDVRRIGPDEFEQQCINHLEQVISNSSDISSKLSEAIKQVRKKSEQNIILLFKLMQGS